MPDFPQSKMQLSMFSIELHFLFPQKSSFCLASSKSILKTEVHLLFLSCLLTTLILFSPFTNSTSPDIESSVFPKKGKYLSFIAISSCDGPKLVKTSSLDPLYPLKTACVNLFTGSVTLLFYSSQSLL